MARKPGRMYRNITQRSYTRREYMGGVPGSKIVTFDIGNLKDEFPVEISMVAKEACQIRHSALESARPLPRSPVRQSGRCGSEPRRRRAM